MQAPTRYRFTVDDYYRMAEAGILREDDRVELIDGEVVQMSPIGSKHASAVDTLTRFFIRSLADRAHVRSQNPVRLSPHNEPEPDLALLLPGEGRYADAHPGPADVLLLIEVSDSTLAYDRDVKLPLYSSFGIPEVWIIDLKRRRLTVYREPRADGYALARTVEHDESVAPLAFPDLALSLGELRI